MNRLLILVTGLFLSAATSSIASAQLVRIGGFGGVSIRAPFVAVDVLPFRGGTRVRAPFTAVNTGLYGNGYAPYPAYRYRPRYYADPYTIARPLYQPQPYYEPPEYAAPLSPTPVISDPVNDSPVSNGSIDQQLRFSAAQLQRNLARRKDDGDIWINYLEPDRIIAVIDRGMSPQQLRPLLNNYIGVVGNSSLSFIWSTDGFRETYRLLDLFVSAGAQSQPINPADAEDNDRQQAAGDAPAADELEDDFDELPPPAAEGRQSDL